MFEHNMLIIKYVYQNEIKGFRFKSCYTNKILIRSAKVRGSL